MLIYNNRYIINRLEENRSIIGEVEMSMWDRWMG